MCLLFLSTFIFYFNERVKDNLFFIVRIKAVVCFFKYDTHIDALFGKWSLYTGMATSYIPVCAICNVATNGRWLFYTRSETL